MNNQHTMPYFDLTGQLCGLSSAEDVSYVWVPVQQVWLTEVRVPGKRRSDWMQALPFALEEKLAQSVEDVFIAVLQRESKGENQGLTQVAVIEKQQMQSWVDELKAQGLEKAQLVVDVFKLPAPNESSWHYLEQADGQRLVRTGVFSGFSADEAWADVLQAKAQAEEDSIVWQEISLATELKVDLKTHGLRQAEFKPVSEVGKRTKIWATAASLLLVVFVLQLGGNEIKSQQYASQTQAVEKQTLALFKKMFPNTKRVVNIKAQTRTALSGNTQQKAQKGMVDLLLKVEPLFNKAKQVQITEIDWKRKQLIFKLNAQQTLELNQLEKQLSKQNKVELNIQNMQQKSVTAQMVIYAK